MNVHLIDGTYELFRHFFAVPSSSDDTGLEIGAIRGVLASLLGMIEGGVTHIGVATDHVIESFRNDLFVGYKTGAGVDPTLLSQFTPLEHALEAMGLTVWPMIEQEADDALAAAAQRASEDAAVEQVVICTPDKDLAQCVVGEQIVQLDRRKGRVWNEAGVWERFGVGPASIPDYLALVGDTADGIPGISGWGARSTATVLARYEHLENIPADSSLWEVSVRGAVRLAAALVSGWEDVLLYRKLATLRTDAPIFREVEELRWKGAQPDFETLCRSIRAENLWKRAKTAALERTET